MSAIAITTAQVSGMTLYAQTSGSYPNIIAGTATVALNNLALDQTTPQTIINGAPLFSADNAQATQITRLTLSNATAGTLAVPVQNSSQFTFMAHRWATDTTVDQTSEWKIYAAGHSGAASSFASAFSFKLLQLIVLAKILAHVVLPTPLGPQKRYACER